MPTGADEIFRISGFIFSRTSVAVKIDGVPYTGVSEINGEDSREGELVHGQRTDGTPLGITSGLYMPGDVTFKALADTAEMIKTQLAAPGSGSFGSVLFSLQLEIFENPSLPTLTIGWDKVKIQAHKFGVPTDATGLQFEFTGKPTGGMWTRGAGVGLTGLRNVLANIAAVTSGGAGT